MWQQKRNKMLVPLGLQTWPDPKWTHYISELIPGLINSKPWPDISLPRQKLKIQLRCEVWEAIFHQIWTGKIAFSLCEAGACPVTKVHMSTEAGATHAARLSRCKPTPVKMAQWHLGIREQDQKAGTHLCSVTLWSEDTVSSTETTCTRRPRHRCHMTLAICEAMLRLRMTRSWPVFSYYGVNFDKKGKEQHRSARRNFLCQHWGGHLHRELSPWEIA